MANLNRPTNRRIPSVALFFFLPRRRLRRPDTPPPLPRLVVQVRHLAEAIVTITNTNTSMTEDTITTDTVITALVMMVVRMSDIIIITATAVIVQGHLQIDAKGQSITISIAAKSEANIMSSRHQIAVSRYLMMTCSSANKNDGFALGKFSSVLWLPLAGFQV